MAAPNGMNPGPGAPYAPGGGIFPNAGHHNDVQHIWKLVDELSQALETNRLKYEELQESILRAQVRPPQTQPQPQENGLVNGDYANHQSPATHSSQPPPNDQTNQIAHLTNQLTASQSRISDLSAHLTASQALLSTYEASIGETTARLRQYAFDHQTHIIALHAHYNALLEQSRNETVQAQLVHQEWQAGLGRLSQGVRDAFGELATGSQKERRRVAALREENRVLRKMVGWEEAVGSSDDESEAGDGSLSAGASAGLSVGSAGGGGVPGGPGLSAEQMSKVGLGFP